ncbi:MAG TPA: hypothetical protein PK453_16050 [Leptospiraceae bacterium]|nr:hypothetical protein [Leptospiraceae bacterium]HNF15181.1 hypothetical protein [Leptospiraceae bacterium]HNI96975.1 hypothetical protein [Leptospiraceae bacterium]HNN03378.1 hypothetical protein [Leptospiraceae bacterium]
MKTTKAGDIESALQNVLTEYIQLKLFSLQKTLGEYEDKWGFSFSQFQEKIKTNTLGKDPYSYEVEKDYWDWEDTVTLIEHFQSISV